MIRAFLLATAAFSCLQNTAQAQEGKETPAKSRIVSLGLFKNGLAVVKREVTVEGPGTYRLDSVPDAIHGTFWIESNAQVEAFVKMRDVELPEDQLPEGSLQEIFQGKKVTVFFNGSKMPPATGIVPKITAKARPEGGHAADRFLVLKTAKGFMYINASEVAAVETDEAGAKATRRKAVLMLTVGKSEKAPVLHVSYLAHGLAWAPSYLLDISDPKKMEMEMATVLRNELSDFADAEVSLISGYPSVEFAQVASPLQAQASWQRFFQELSNRGTYDHSILTQNFATVNTAVSVRPGTALGATPEGEGVDLHYQPIGKRSLKAGEALSLTLGTAKTDYERMVEWNVTRPAGNLGLREGGKEDMWDVLAFKNPFKFPLTTAPAMIMEKGRFNGQRSCFWTNVGEETRVKITRSLSLRTSSQEELDKSRPIERVAVGRRDYSKIHIKGELRINNHRKEPIKVVVSYNVRGLVEETEAPGAARVTLQPGSLTDVNPLNEIVWVLTLNPGEEKRLTYGYGTLVDR